MSNLREIRARIKTVKSIKNVTSAIQKITATRLSKAKSRLQNFRKYFKEMDGLMHLTFNPNQGHCLVQKNKSAMQALIVFSSDKGFCGAFNKKIFETAAEFTNSYNKENIRLIVVGKKGINYFTRRGYEIFDKKENISPLHNYETAEETGDTVINLYLKDEISQAHILSTEMVTMGKSNPVIRKILPIEFETKNDAEDLYLFEPESSNILEALLPYYIKLQIWSGLLESMVSENAARVIVMERATTNAEEMIDELKLVENKLRQSQITTELSDIVGAAESLT